MGVDFISAKAPKFKKGWDRAAAALATPDLFRPQPSSEARQIQGDIVAGAKLVEGEALTVRLTDAGVVAYRHDAVVAEFSSLPGEIVEALRVGYGVASAKVEGIDNIGGTVRVSLK